MTLLEKQSQSALEQSDPRLKRRERTLPLAVVALLAVLALIGTLFFYKYLDETLFRERNSHFIEISDKVTQVIQSAVRHYRTVTNTVENLLVETDAQDAREVTGRLEEIEAYLELEPGSVLAFDREARLYVSDGAESNWQDAALLADERERQELVTTLDYRMDGGAYILFLKKLDAPVELQEREITHVGVVVNVAVFQEAFDADVFANRSHVYVISPNGRRLYRHQCEGGFIDGYNLLTALEEYTFIHGGSLKDMRENIEKRVSAGYEFVYGKERYFVAASPVGQTDWSVLTFVPTEVLGAGTTEFLNMAVVYATAIVSLAVLMIGLLLYFFMAKKSDKQIIEHQRKTNEMLKDAAAAANAASEAKSNFLSHMSHDIRTPINGIMGMTDIALKNLGDITRVEDCLNKIESSSGHLLSLVNDVLDMSRIESGKTRIAREPMDMRQVIGHCTSIIGGQLQGRAVELVEEFEELPHPRVLGDELHLRQVLINILGNAVKFTPDGGKIYFRIQELSAEEEEVLFRLEVEDTGVGMTPEFLPHIFEAFAQEDDGTRTVYKGTGLGMTITKQFVDLMGGSLTVESQVNVGTCFTLELPLPIDLETRESQEEVCEEAELAGARLLLAEDNELNMEIAQYMLEDVGIEVVPAMDGQGALDTFSASEPGYFDGILMDVMMPVMDGLEATRAIRALDREDAKTVPIIAMTANAYDEDKRRCLEAGMNAHMAKPIDGGTLIRILEHYIKPRQ